MKRHFTILIALVVIVAVMSGCGGSDSLSGRVGMLYFYADT